MVDSQSYRVLAVVGDAPEEDLEGGGSTEEFGSQDEVEIGAGAGEGREMVGVVVTLACRAFQHEPGDAKQ